MSNTLLIVEDDSAIRDLLQTVLQREGHRVVEAANTALASLAVADDPPDLVLLDWMLPGESGLSYLKRLRADALTRALPVLLLTARDAEADVVSGLDAGADDYITKPFSPRELISRVRAHLRRHGGTESESLRVGPLCMDTAAHRVSAEGETLAIRGTEYKMLRFLMENPGRVYSRSQLLDHIWGRGAFLEERTVDVHVLRLRKLLKPAGLAQMVVTVRGAGYKLEPA